MAGPSSKLPLMRRWVFLIGAGAPPAKETSRPSAAQPTMNGFIALFPPKCFSAVYPREERRGHTNAVLLQTSRRRAARSSRLSVPFATAPAVRTNDEPLLRGERLDDHAASVTANGHGAVRPGAQE